MMEEFDRQQKIPEFAYPRYLFKRTLVPSKDEGTQDKVALMMKTLVLPKGKNRYVPVTAGYVYDWEGQQDIDTEMTMSYGFHTLCWKVYNGEELQFQKADHSYTDNSIDFSINDDDELIT